MCGGGNVIHPSDCIPPPAAPSLAPLQRWGRLARTEIVPVAPGTFQAMSPMRPQPAPGWGRFFALRKPTGWWWRGCARALAIERGRQLRRPYFGGLPRFVKKIPCMSAALRNMPAFFRASVFSCPAGIRRAASRASIALASQSMASVEGCIRFIGGALLRALYGMGVQPNPVSKEAAQ